MTRGKVPIVRKKLFPGKLNLVIARAAIVPRMVAKKEERIPTFKLFPTALINSVAAGSDLYQRRVNPSIGIFNIGDSEKENKIRSAMGR